MSIPGKIKEAARGLANLLCCGVFHPPQISRSHSDRIVLEPSLVTLGTFIGDFGENEAVVEIQFHRIKDVEGIPPPETGLRGVLLGSL